MSRLEGHRGTQTLRSLGLLEGATLFGPVDADAPVAGLAVDSREARAGYVFFAIKGEALDGAEFAQFALRQKAFAVVCTEEGRRTALRDVSADAPFIVVDDPRLALARAAAAFYGAQPEVMAAVTGTNGKTSVAAFLRQIWVALGLRAVNFGTTGVEGVVAAKLSHTTPEPITLHALLADLADAGVTHAAMEASSHGLAQRRLDGVRLTAGAITNITRDHMDYHADHDDYVAAKLGLFDRVLPKGAVAVLNVDDPCWGAARLVAEGRRQRVIGVGKGEAALLRILGQEFHAGGQKLTFHWAGDMAAAHEVDLALIGGFQGENALTAAALAIGCGADAAEVFAALPKLTGVRGRMELVATRGNGGAVYVDYSHTPDSLATALKALRLHTPDRLIVVFGAGGDRDPGKRPLMGAAAAEFADVAIVTDDNPRSEDPAKIRAAVMAGCPEASEIGDRAEAILTGVDMLGPGDRLLIAGKGHETGQIVGDRVIEFDDSEQARVSVDVLDGQELGA
jgi:UDP-N-acetylmuramoyl-L-alanyl-D-glutamate--2,6-diaminopimelate ligase